MNKIKWYKKVYELVNIYLYLIILVLLFSSYANGFG